MTNIEHLIRERQPLLDFGLLLSAHHHSVRTGHFLPSIQTEENQSTQLTNDQDFAETDNSGSTNKIGSESGFFQFRRRNGK